MGRFARVVALGVAHHVTQRGNARQYILSSDTDREVYLGLLREHAAKHESEVLGYCLMSNHVHLVVVPRLAESLALTLKHTHGRFAAYWNAKQGSSGHVWQGRFYSCPLDRPHLWAALRYTELNPVRAGMVEQAEAWRWSSAAVHCGMAAEGWLRMEEWRDRWEAVRWREYLRAGTTDAELKAMRQSTHTGRPLGSTEFVRELEERMERSLARRTGGRPARASVDTRQDEFVFEA